MVDGFRQPALGVQKKGQITLREGVFGVEANGLLHVAQGLVLPTLLVQGTAKIDLAVSRIGLDADAFSQVLDGLIQPATGFQGHANVIVKRAGSGSMLRACW